MTRFVVTLQAETALGFFDRVSRQLRDTRALRRSLGELLVDSTRARFVASRGPDGAAWEPLAPSTVAAWIEGFGKSLRNRRGELNAAGRRKLGARKPLVGASRRLATEIVYRLDGESLLVGSALAYAPFHQFGTDPYTIRPRNAKMLFWPGARHPARKVNHPGVPARPFVGLSERDARDMVVTTAEHLLRQSFPPRA